jgi:hypothetical protein
MWGKAFWKDTFNRIVWTIVEVAVPLVTAVELLPQLDYTHALWVTAGAALVTFLKQAGKEARKGFTPDPSDSLIR